MITKVFFMAELKKKKKSQQTKVLGVSKWPLNASHWVGGGYHCGEDTTRELNDTSHVGVLLLFTLFSFICTPSVCLVF